MSIESNTKDFENELDNLIKAVGDLENEYYGHLKDDIEELVNENENLKDRIADMEEEIYDLKDQIEALTRCDD